MRIAFHVPTGRILSVQSAATEGTMIAVAKSEWPDIPSEEVEERVLPLNEYKELKAAQPRTLDEARAEKLATINAAFTAAIAEGLAYGGKVIQIDDAGRQNIAAAATRAIGVALQIPGLAWPEGFAWRTADNSTLALTPAMMLEMGEAAADLFTRLLFHRGALKDALEAAATLEEIAAIDTSAGW